MPTPTAIFRAHRTHALAAPPLIKQQLPNSDGALVSGRARALLSWGHATRTSCTWHVEQNVSNEWVRVRSDQPESKLSHNTKSSTSGHAWLVLPVPILPLETVKDICIWWNGIFEHIFWIFGGQYISISVLLVLKPFLRKSAGLSYLRMTLFWQSVLFSIFYLHYILSYDRILWYKSIICTFLNLTYNTWYEPFDFRQNKIRKYKK